MIDAKIKALGDWRDKTLAKARTLIKDADPDVGETVDETAFKALIRAAVALNTSKTARAQAAGRRRPPGPRPDEIVDTRYRMLEEQ